MTHVLLLGRTPFEPRSIEAEITVPGVEISSGTSLDDVIATFASGHVDAVIMGAGIPLTDRIAIVEHVVASSESTTVHMKDRASGQPGMMPFVNAVLRGLTSAA